jgi:HAE1 family hydrophobic/amphiphilic exporter-1/multidrug efflux pump
LPIALSLGAASTSRIGMGVVNRRRNRFSLVLTLFVIPALYFMWSKAKNTIPFEHIEEYENESKYMMPSKSYKKVFLFFFVS